MSDVLQTIIDANAYMTLATADEHGNPWASPVWFATVDYRELVWVSSPQARHSRNIAVRPDVAVAIFNSQQPPGTGEGVYISARAEEVPQSELDRCLGIFATISERQGLDVWGRENVEPPARLRLYHAIAVEHFVLSKGDERLSVQLD